MTETVLHLGTNLGFRTINLELAEVLVSNYIGEIKQLSSIYQTAPWGVTDQAPFLNQAMVITTGLSPKDILRQIHNIEHKLGRIKEEKWGPRIIDIDIIFYGQVMIENPDLKIPHPHLTNRSFVLKPLLEICPEWKHPQSGQTIRELFRLCPDKGSVEVYEQ